MTEKSFIAGLYDAGYAVRNYDITTKTDLFRYRNEYFRLPAGAVKETYLTEDEMDKIGGRRYFKGPMPVVRIEAVKEVLRSMADNT